MNPGDLVQIRQHLYLPENTVAKPPVQPGKSEAWIYAECVDFVYDAQGENEVNARMSGVRVKVQHPGNHQHHEEITVAPADVRTAADVDILAAQATTPERKKHFQVQADRLKKANSKPAARVAPIR